MSSNSVVEQVKTRFRKLRSSPSFKRFRRRKGGKEGGSAESTGEPSEREVFIGKRRASNRSLGESSIESREDSFYSDADHSFESSDRSRTVSLPANFREAETKSIGGGSSTTTASDSTFPATPDHSFNSAALHPTGKQEKLPQVLPHFSDDDEAADDQPTPVPHAEDTGAEASREIDHEGDTDDALKFVPNDEAIFSSDVDIPYSVSSDMGRPLETIYEVDSRIGSALPSAASELAPGSFAGADSYAHPTLSISACHNFEDESMSPVEDFAHLESEESEGQYRSSSPRNVLEPTESSSSLPLPSFDSVMDSLEPLPTPEPSARAVERHNETQRHHLCVTPSTSLGGRSRSPTMSTISGIEWFPAFASAAAERPTEYGWPLLPSEGGEYEEEDQHRSQRSTLFSHSSSVFSTSTPVVAALSLPDDTRNRVRTLSLPFFGLLQSGLSSGLPSDSLTADGTSGSTIPRRIRAISSYFSTVKSVYSIAQRSTGRKHAVTMSYLSVLPPVLRLYTVTRSVFLSPSAFATSPVVQDLSSWRANDVD